MKTEWREREREVNENWVESERAREPPKVRHYSMRKGVEGGGQNTNTHDMTAYEDFILM